MHNPRLKKMFTLLSFFAFFLVSSMAAASDTSQAPGHPNKEQKGPAILLVTFGTSVKSAQVALDNIDKRVKVAFPQTEIRWAYTSNIIRKKLAKSGKIIDSPEMAMARLMDEGYTKVAVQSLHIIPGAEFHEVRANAKLFSQMIDGINRVMVGWPLLVDDVTMDKTLKAILDSTVPKNRKADEAVVLMGHGTHHPSNAIYSALMYRAQLLDPNIYMATVEGSPSFDDVKTLLAKKKVKKVYLVPFMSVAGDHAMNDMAGKEEDSWKSQLEKMGIQAVPVMKGLAELDPVVDIWIEHIKVCLAHLK
jgi:Cobalamin biosynthesis protein CbiK, Co2+ chelatase